MSAAPQLARLDAIAAVFARDPDALALLALGSLAEPSRADRYSDLDFFAIVRTREAKRRLVADLGWLAEAHPIAFAYSNTPDGHKVLFADGLFAELAVFELEELERIPFSPGRVVWAREGLELGRLGPRVPLPPPSAHGEDWLVGEILTLLFVGLSRDARGELYAGMVAIQRRAVELWLALVDQRARAADPERLRDGRDPFDPARRLERRCPELAPTLARVCPGYGRSPDAARALLAALSPHPAWTLPLIARIEELLAATRPT